MLDPRGLARGRVLALSIGSQDTLSDNKSMASQKVIICDDAGFIRSILSQTLEELGYQVVAECISGIEVVQAVAKYNPDFLFLDLVLPEQNGVEACAEIRKFNQGLRIVAMTSLEEDFARPRIEQAGCDHWLAKPFTKTQVQEVLWKLVKPNQEARSG